ncbi:hypothetical protein [Streptomyces sp. NEAU-W12]|uniref:hypothetical protein n=1 Tax=Streptomyces sp. NEAU-W12 TaxID=2994668 RepID=UPI00224B7D59|nr:hypothetical protein [Streptomyces sp. NEAU-W12]
MIGDARVSLPVGAARRRTAVLPLGGQAGRRAGGQAGRAGVAGVADACRVRDPIRAPEILDGGGGEGDGGDVVGPVACHWAHAR